MSCSPDGGGSIESLTDAQRALPVEVEQIDGYNGLGRPDDGRIDACGYFADFYRNGGGEYRFGFPVTDVLLETTDDGRTVARQVFQNAEMQMVVGENQPWLSALGEHFYVDHEKKSLPDGVELKDCAQVDDATLPVCDRLLVDAAGLEYGIGFRTAYLKLGESNVGRPLTPLIADPEQPGRYIQWFTKSRMEFDIAQPEAPIHFAALGDRYAEAQRLPPVADLNKIDSSCFSSSGAPLDPGTKVVAVSDYGIFDAVASLMGDRNRATLTVGAVAEATGTPLVTRLGLASGGLVLVVGIGTLAYKLAFPPLATYEPYDPSTIEHDATSSFPPNESDGWTSPGTNAGNLVWRTGRGPITESITDGLDIVGYCQCDATYDGNAIAIEQTGQGKREHAVPCGAVGSRRAISQYCTLKSCETACSQAASDLTALAQQTTWTVHWKRGATYSYCREATMKLDIKYAPSSAGAATKHMCVPTPPLYPLGGTMTIPGIKDSQVREVIRNHLPYTP